MPMHSIPTAQEVFLRVALLNVGPHRDNVRLTLFTQLREDWKRGALPRQALGGRVFLARGLATGGSASRVFGRTKKDNHVYEDWKRWAPQGAALGEGVQRV